MHEVKSESEVAQLCLTLRDPMDCSLPSSSVHGIFQARVLECGAIAYLLQLVGETDAKENKKEGRRDRGMKRRRADIEKCKEESQSQR